MPRTDSQREYAVPETWPALLWSERLMNAGRTYRPLNSIGSLMTPSIGRWGRETGGEARMGTSVSWSVPVSRVLAVTPAASES